MGLFMYHLYICFSTWIKISIFKVFFKYIFLPIWNCTNWVIVGIIIRITCIMLMSFKKALVISIIISVSIKIRT